MYRFKFAQHVPGKDSNQHRERKSRASGEIFIVREPVLPPSSSETRCHASRLTRQFNKDIAGHYKYSGPTALRSLTIAVLLIASLSIFAGAANAQRRAAQTSAPSIPSPRSVFGFTPGDDRTIADWKQITDYFARLDKASDRVQVQTIGTSTLGRTMIAAFISAPEN